MLRFYGNQPPLNWHLIMIGGVCPHCGDGGTYRATSTPDMATLNNNKIMKVALSYACNLCLGTIPVEWTIHGWHDASSPNLGDPKELIPTREPFDFSSVPEAVRREIGEALDCMSVNAYHGFAALIRRAVQAIATDLGAGASSRVEGQMMQGLKIAGLAGEGDWEELVRAVVKTGHDGSHPNLPEVDADRARILLVLLRDLTQELYTRPGRIKEAAALRQAAIAKQQG